jgi:hypothetical protein
MIADGCERSRWESRGFVPDKVSLVMESVVGVITGGKRRKVADEAGLEMESGTRAMTTTGD